MPHALAGHTVSEDDFRRRYVGPVLAHSGINIVLFIQDKVSLHLRDTSSMIVYLCLLSYSDNYAFLYCMSNSMPDLTSYVDIMILSNCWN